MNKKETYLRKLIKEEVKKIIKEGDYITNSQPTKETFLRFLNTFLKKETNIPLMGIDRISKKLLDELLETNFLSDDFYDLEGYEPDYRPEYDD